MSVYHVCSGSSCSMYIHIQYVVCIFVSIMLCVYQYRSCYLFSYSYMHTHLCAGVRILHTTIVSFNFIFIHEYTSLRRREKPTHKLLYASCIFMRIHEYAPLCGRSESTQLFSCIRVNHPRTYLHVSCILTCTYECPFLCGWSESTQLFTYMMYQSETLTYISTYIMYIHTYI